MMNVYIIEITDAGEERQGSPINQYDEFMTVAETEERARAVCAEQDWDSSAELWTEERFSTCRLVKEGDIVSSFNAG